MADAYKVGDIATNPSTGEQKQFNGREWVKVTGSTPRVAPKMSVEAQKQLNGLNAQAAAARETATEYSNAQAALKRLKPGPFRGAFLDAAIPEQGGNLMDKLGSIVIGGPAKILGAVTPQDTTDFQRLKGLQAQRVLTGQIEQKGPQTDSDAARLNLTEISPYKTSEVNAAVVDSGRKKADRAIKRAPFYSKWANTYGLNGVDEKGRSVEQAFQEDLNKSSAPKGNGGWKLVK